MDFFINIVLLITGFILLIKGADWLVEGSSSLAKRFKIPEIAIGLTVVAFGTSMPEFVVNFFGSLKGANDIVLGNIIGSNIFNLLLILGSAGLVYPIVVQKNTAHKEIPYSLLAVLVVYLLANDTLFSQASNIIDRFDGSILLLFFIAFLGYIWHLVKNHEIDLGVEDIPSFTLLKTTVYLILGFIGMFGGGKLVVDSAVELATVLGISQKIIAVTIISAGTSLPELVTSTVAALKKKSDIAIGNIVGSNIFNIFYILGISAVISPIGYDSDSYNPDLYVLAASSALLLTMLFVGKKYNFGRIKALVFLLSYIAYIVYILSR